MRRTVPDSAHPSAFLGQGLQARDPETHPPALAAPSPRRKPGPRFKEHTDGYRRQLCRQSCLTLEPLNDSS